MSQIERRRRRKERRRTRDGAPAVTLTGKIPAPTYITRPPSQHYWEAQIEGCQTPAQVARVMQRYADSCATPSAYTFTAAVAQPG